MDSEEDQRGAGDLEQPLFFQAVPSKPLARDHGRVRPQNHRIEEAHFL